MKHALSLNVIMMNIICSRVKHESPSPPSVLQRKIDFKEKISDTSLFAELVKDKHKRAKVTPTIPIIFRLVIISEI